MTRFLLLSALFLLLNAPQPACAAAADQPAPTLLSADAIRHNDQTNITEAAGKVELIQGRRILRADKLRFNQSQDVVTAEGNVVLTENDGNVTFADRVEVTGNLKRGFVNQLRAMLSDNSRIAAAEAERIGEDGRYQVMRRVVYSPCNLCKEDKTKAPLWQLKADKVTRDEQDLQIIYRDAWLEMAGLPVFYTPYFSHPDPSVKRRSGFLAPGFGNNPNIGRYIRPGYYFDIAPQTDATLYPTFSTNDGAQFAGELRHRFERGRLAFDGSFINADRVNDQNLLQKNQWRGHLFGTAEYDINNIWRTGADIAFTSDKSYLYRYRVPTADVLRNRAFLEGFSGRHYANASLYYFQDLRSGDRPAEPFVTPLLTVSALGEPGKTLGGRWSADGSMAVLTRDEGVKPATRKGPDSARMSGEVGWQRVFTSGTGLVTTADASIRGDGFYADNFKNTDTGAAINQKFTFRYLPRGSLVMRYPMGRQSGRWQQLVEPIVGVTASPRLKSQPEIVNEDSVDVEFDDTNLFAKNRFTGADLQEGGIRGIYAMRAGAYNDAGARVDGIFGQSYRLSSDARFPVDSGLQNKWSDYVGRVMLRPYDWLSAAYGFRLDRRDLTPRRSEVDASAGPEWFRPNLNYVSVDRTDATGARQKVAEMTIGVSSHFYEYWTAYVTHKRAVSPDAGPRNTSYGLTYGDECLNASIGVSQDATTRPDIEPGTSVFFTLLFKNLGGIKGQSFQLGGANATAQN